MGRIVSIHAGEGRILAAVDGKRYKGTERSLALQLNFPLIADESGEVGRLYEFDATGATAIVLDPRGVVRFVRRDPVDGVRDFEDLLHAVRVLQFTDAYAGAVWAA